MRTLLLAGALLLAGCDRSDAIANQRIEALEQRVSQVEKRKQLPNPMTEAEHKLIPSGTVYLAPDGTARLKK